MAVKTKLGELLLEAYKEALTTRKPNDFTVVGISSTIIRLEGREGRIAVQATQRSIRPNSAALTSARQSQAGEAKKSVRLTFPKQEEETGEAASETATKFGLKRVGATQDNDPNKSLPDNHGQSQQSQSGNNADAADSTEEMQAEIDYWKAKALANEQQPDTPSEEDQGLFKETVEGKAKEAEKPKAGNPNLPELKDPPPPPAKAEPKAAKPEPAKTEALPLSEGEQDLVKTMKPGGVGREFGLDRLRATLSDLGMEWKEEHSATVLAGALLKHLNPK